MLTGNYELPDIKNKKFRAFKENNILIITFKMTNNSGKRLGKKVSDNLYMKLRKFKEKNQ